MQLKTILNRVTDYKSFVFGKITWVDEKQAMLEVELEPRMNGRPICSGCGQQRERLRPGSRAAAIRVHTAVGVDGSVRVPDASGGLPHLWRENGTGSLGRRQEYDDHGIPLVPGPLGQADVVEGK